MIMLRRADERQHLRSGKRDVWFTFHPESRADPLVDGFGALAAFNEDRLPPRASVPLHHPHGDEIVTYVLDGALAHKDPMGRSTTIHAGEFHRMTARRGIRHSATNASRTDWAHVFQISLYASECGLDPINEQKRFSTAQRRGVLCVVASPDGRKGSLRISQDTLICSAMLDPGQHLVHELSPGRSAWLHIVRGEVTLGDDVLTVGDGVGFTAERAVSFTAREESEILLLDLGGQLPTSPENERVPGSVGPPECRDRSGIDVWEAEGGA